ncbi:hypothetical protein PSHT_11729 [Puccinia striiformis]|uniref:PD-(D/E)XK nuclease family transposase n=1 Tax=Puccinia striiformis TaxID=27350 RepID=A0A2S4V1B3_9BASI|nr:hypothetical protein PSHT_11729 [Puccinia striiformis]
MLHELPCSLHFSVCREELKTSSSRTLTTRDLITPLTDAAFKRLFSDPALLKGFLNSIFDKEGFSIEEIKQTVNLACFTPGSQEPAYAATQEVASRQQSPGSPVIDPKYLPSENAGDDRAGLSVRYDLVAVTDQGTTIDIEMQRAFLPHDLDRVAFYSSRLVTASSGWAGKKEHWNNSAKLDPASSPQQPQPPTLRNYRCNPVYVISICDFPWKNMGIPEQLQVNGFCGWDHIGISENVQTALGDRVDATLEKLVWILANTGQNLRDRLVPEWTETDPTAKLCYASLTPIERRFYDKQEGLEQSYWAAVKHQIEEGLATKQERSHQITEQLAAKQEQNRQTTGQLAAKQERDCCKTQKG